MSFTDQLNIETPEQVELRFPIAGVGSRFLAILTDTLIQISAVLLLVLVLGLIGMTQAAQKAAARTTTDTADKWAIALMLVFFFLVFWGYFSLFEAFWHGQTPGKRLLKIRVIKDSGRQITLFEALARNLLRVVDMQLSYLVGVACMLCNKQQKRLGDLVAGTIVVHDRGEDQPLLAQHGRTITAGMYASSAGQAARRPVYEDLPGDAVARLTRADLHVMETFFARALDLKMTTREEMGARIAGQIAGKMGVAGPEENPERFLQAVMFEMRSLGR